MNGFHDFQPRQYVFVPRIIDGYALPISLHEHCLDHAFAVEGLHLLDECGQVIAAVGTVYPVNVVGVDRIELQQRIVNLKKGFENGGFKNVTGIRENADFGRRRKTVSQGDNVVDNFREFRVRRGLAVSGKSKVVGLDAVCSHFNEFFL